MSGVDVKDQTASTSSRLPVYGLKFACFLSNVVVYLSETEENHVPLINNPSKDDDVNRSWRHEYIVSDCIEKGETKSEETTSAMAVTQSQI